VKVCVYVEGGGPKAKSQTATACRKAFHVFFEKVLGDRRKPRVIASGSRDEAYHDFCRSLDNDPDSFPVLVVDSEDPIASGRTATEHLRNREKHWTKVMPDGQVYLMVQCMEAWFLADRPALGGYYGEGFKSSSLPSNPKIEEIPKKDLMNGLAGATKGTKKGPYHKTNHGFDLLERINPDRVRQASPRADDLIEFLRAKLP
jgi:hypothetical protein